MSPETKKKLTYAILGIVYFAGGIEYGVSVPRGWLHWRKRDQTPDHVVGLVVAAYSLATFFVAPFMGRWVDRPGRSKSVLVIGTLLHIVGAVLEFFLTQQWTNIVARFLSGLGGGIDAVVLSETSRYTSRSRRTSAMALLVGVRFFGHLIVPGLDALLWKEVLEYIPLPQRRTAASGMFLLILWALVLLLIILFYTELCRLQPIASSPTSPNIVYSQKYSDPQRPNAYVTGTVSSALGESYDIVSDGVSYSSSQPVSIPASLTSSQCSEHEQMLARSSEMIEEAEKYIQKAAAEQASPVSATKPFVIEPTRESYQHQLSWEQSEITSDQMSTSFNVDDDGRKRSELKRGAGVEEGDVSITLSSGTFDQNSYVQRYGTLPRRLHVHLESIFYSMFEEFIRDDIVALLAILMSGTFSHLCFQMLITPVTEQFLDGMDLYVVIIFCVAVILLVTVCLLVWGFNPQRQSLRILMVGACVLIGANIVFMTLLSHMDSSDENAQKNCIQIGVSVALYVMGLPLLTICATSLYTQLSRQQNHGLRQGVYHSILSLSAILAPLWIEGTLMRPYLHHSVIIGLLLFSLTLVFCSRKRIALLCVSSRKNTTGRQNSVRNRTSNTEQNPEQQPLLS
ncbi:uncharacterized protein [Littorina saxatilis]|uniref:Major facilitator superfamily (MFS) profile domain-containing protein n=1 Tax=Littorina saxatilis TaxID=31220 RepID=A0AAN9AUK2_9CAEN